MCTFAMYYFYNYMSISFLKLFQFPRLQIIDLDNGRWRILMLSVLNLFFLHYYFYFAGLLEWTFMYSIPTNICSILFDSCFLFFLSLILCRGNIKPALAILYSITFLWSFVNVFYSRFFFQYMSISAIEEAHGLLDGIVIDTMMTGFSWLDMYYISSLTLFLFFYRKSLNCHISLSESFCLLKVAFFSLLFMFFVYSVYHFLNPRYRNNWEMYGFRISELFCDITRGGTPNLSHFQTGAVRSAIFETANLFVSHELTNEERKEIQNYYLPVEHRVTENLEKPRVKNVLFILLESFLSAPIDLVVDGQEITPFLNSLKRDSTVYYNGKMHPNITCGESGDGQFIYMTGILPLRYKMTVGAIKNQILPAIPRLLKEEKGIKHTEIIVPTNPYLWQQKDVNSVYGIDYMYSINDICSNSDEIIDDSNIFQFASHVITPNIEPFFSMVLSLSTHSPYDSYIGENLLATNTSLPKEYRNYLNTCHFTDKQLRLFIESLKTNRLYERTLIVIVADHHAHIDRLNMVGRIDETIPLFIVNGNIDKSSSCTSACNQLDVYTTLVDLLDIDSEWLGLGHTLLQPKYQNSVTDEAWRLSEWIIDGNYFSKLK